MRQLSTLDNLIGHIDRALRSVSTGTHYVDQPSPAENEPEAELDEQERQHALGLMRVNHAGEVCAQALYQGQGLTAKLADVRSEMEKAADEEIDHLAWCEQRIKELGGHTSLLNPLWYSMSFTIGATAGLIGDNISLGFVAATEDQVSKHLKSHLERLPNADVKSKAIVHQMLEDEQRHAQIARDAGGSEFPSAVKSAMTLTSKAMTTLSYRI